MEEMATHLPVLIHTSEAARILHVAGETVRAMERRGVLSAVRMSNGTRLFDREVVERLAARREARLPVGAA